jgi:hypothetical protein
LIDALSDGRLYSFPFSYRGGLEYDNAFLIGSGGDVFIAVGREARFEFVRLNQAAVLDNLEEEEISADDLEFGML